MLRVHRATGLAQAGAALRRLASMPAPAPFDDIYTGPLARPVRSVKLFSVTSLGLTIVGSPLLAVLVSDKMPLIAGAVIAASAVAVSCSTTGLLAWFAKPYVTRLSVSRSDRALLRAETLTLLGRPQTDEFHLDDVSLQAGRPFASFRVVPTGKTYFVHPMHGDPGHMDVLARLSRDTQREMERGRLRADIRRELDAAEAGAQAPSTAAESSPRR